MWNLGADVRSTFFKSASYSPHGMGDTALYYMAGGVLHGLGLPISDRNLWRAGATTNLLLALAVALFAVVGARSVGMVYVATLLIALSPLYVFASQTSYARVTFTPLVQVAALVLAAFAHRRPGWISRAALVAVAFFLELTDGFYFGPVLLVFLFLQHGGSLRERITAALRDSTWRWTAAAITAGLAIDIGLGALAAANDTTLTLFGYVGLRARSGGVLTTADLLRLWMRAIGFYLPLVGAALVIPSWLVALRYSWSEPVAGTLALWLGIASAGVLKYYGSATRADVDVGPITGYMLALPSYLIVAWVCGRGLRSGAGPVARTIAVAACAAAAIPMAVQLATERYVPELQVRTPTYTTDIDQCLVVKAAGAYVREQAVPDATVFHLSDENRLGLTGEFYYGLSYVGNNHTGEHNRLIDFGTKMVGHRYAPEQLARAYGVPHFTYYVEFLPTTDVFVREAVAGLERSGARVALEVRDQDRAIGRVWRFEAGDGAVMQVDEIAARWNRVGHLPQLFQQSLAGTAFHFGPSWPVPVE